MPLHLPNAVKGGPKSPLSRSSANLSSVNKSTTFGLGPGQWKVRDEAHPVTLLMGLRQLRERGDFSDITFTYDGESINANRIVLAAVSSVMRNVFTKRENLMNAEVLPPEALHQLVRFIYSSSAEVDYDVLKQIEKASRVLDIQVVTKMCNGILDSLPVYAEDQVMKRRRKPLKRTNSVDQSSLDEASSLLYQSSIESKIPSPDENLVEHDVSDILVGGMKRDNRPSIKLTFHSRSGTPVNRSTEDLTKVAECGSSESEETMDTEMVSNNGANENDKKSEKIPDLNVELSTGDGKSDTAERSWQQKRKQYSLSKSLDDSVLDSSTSEAGSQKPKTPIPLSKFLRSSHSSVAVAESLAIKSQLKDSPSNGTWPKSVVTSPRRKDIPTLWKKTSGLASSEALNPDANSKKNVRKKLHPARDVLTVGFKSKSIPNYLKGLNSLREQNLFCDLTIIVLNTRIRCHKVVLAASSEVFYAILKKINSKEIVLTKIDEAAIQEMIRFIYTGQCSLDKDNVMGVMRGSRRFQLHFIAKKCASYLDQYVSSYGNFFTAENVLVTYKLAGEYGFPKLREECKKFAVSKFWEITDSQCFKDLNSIELNRLLSSDYLRTSKIRDSDQEMQFFRALLQWLTYRKTRIPQMTARVMKFVNFSNIKLGSLNRVVVKEPIVMQEKETHERILEALKVNSNSCKRSQSMQLPQSPFGNMTLKRSSLLYNDIYAFVTEPTGGESSKNVNKVYNISDVTGKTTVMTSSPVVWNGHAVTSHNGVLYVAGGRDAKKSKRICSHVYKYDKDMWTQLPSMNVVRSHFSLVSLGGALYAIGGLSENMDKQYIATTSCEKLDLEPNRGNLKWKLTAMSLPGPSYSHSAVTCFMSSSNTDMFLSQNKLDSARLRHRFSKLNERTFEAIEKNKEATVFKNTNRSGLLFRVNEGKLKVPASPLRKKGLKINSPFNDSKSPLFTRGSPRQSSIKIKKQSHGQSLSNHHEVIFICGGKCNPTQNVLVNPKESSKFVEKSPLPCPSTSLSLTSLDTTVYFACDDIMETSQFRVFEYKVDHDQWSELKIPVIIGNPPPCTNIDVLAKGSKKLFSSVINCVATSTGFCLAVSSGNVITMSFYDVNSIEWTPHRRIKLKAPIIDFNICSI